MRPYYAILKDPVWKEIKTPSQAPFEQHWVIMLFDKKSVYHEADERSKQFPGHGYPAYSEEFMTHQIYFTLDEKAWVEALRQFYLDDQHRTDILAYVIQKKAKMTPQVTIS